MQPFPSLAGSEATRRTLHCYARAVGVIPRVHARSHPQWWHVSLRLVPTGLRTAKMALPGGDSAWLEVDLINHMVTLQMGIGGVRALSMRDGATGTEFGNQLLVAAEEIGLPGDYPREKFESDTPRAYDPDHARLFLSVLSEVQRIFAAHRARLTGSMGPIQLWPHGFDLAFEWFGTRKESYEEHGEVREFPAQLNLGFSAGDEPYFYSNPWPFEGEKLLSRTLPAGAAWHTNGWQGTKLPYSELVGDANAEARLLEYARIVYELARPTLTA